MPTYVYDILDKDGEPTGEQFEAFQSIKDDAFTECPDTGRPVRRAIVVPNVQHSGPAWDWCEATKRYINKTKPKWIRDDKSGIRKRFPKGGV